MLTPLKNLHRVLFAIFPILISSLLCTQAVQAQSAKNSSPQPQFERHAQAQPMAQRLAEQHGIPVEQTMALLAQAQYMPKVVEAVKPPKTKSVRNWDNYRARFVEPYRIRKGLEFWRENAEVLQQAEIRYGVPQAVIVAIIGVETIYGQHTGNYRVIDALATLGFAYPSGQRDRSDFFQKELEAFIALCSSTHLDCLEVKGSYAGAIGLGQFMPSSWTAYAVDGDEDGIVDLFHSRKDAIFSVANFLKVHGWQTGAATRALVQVDRTDNLAELLGPDIVPTFTAAEMQARGVRVSTPVKPDEKLALIELVRGDAEPAFVAGGQNFYVVTRYNRSSFYANAVLELSEALALQAGKTPVER